MDHQQPSVYADGEYARRNPSYHVQDAAWKARQILKILRGREDQVQSIGEVGCGVGEVLYELQRGLPPSVRFSGYDISPQGIERAARRANERLHFECADFLRLETEAFDLLLIIDVIEHVEDFMTFLRTIRGRGRYKVFHIPLEMNAQSILRNRPIDSRSQLAHLHYFMKDTALSSLRETGYQIIDWVYTPSGCGLKNRGWKADVMKVPRRLLAALNPDFAARSLGGFSLLILAT